MILGYLALCWLLGMAAAAFAEGNPWAIAAGAVGVALIPLAGRRTAIVLLWSTLGAGLLVGGAPCRFACQQRKQRAQREPGSSSVHRSSRGILRYHRAGWNGPGGRRFARRPLTAAV